MGRWDEAQQYVVKALGIVEKGLGTEHSDTATTRSQMAVLKEGLGNHAEAARWMQKAAQGLERKRDHYPDFVRYMVHYTRLRHLAGEDIASEFPALLKLASDPLLSANMPTLANVFGVLEPLLDGYSPEDEENKRLMNRLYPILVEVRSERHRRERENASSEEAPEDSDIDDPG